VPTYTKHARELMLERRISTAEVEDVLAHHQIDRPDPKGNRIVIGHPGGRRVKVVVAKDSDPLKIITAAD